ncbi:hypothetical protein D3C79_646880 [compost metagenome]
MLQVEALGLRAIQVLVERGAGHIVADLHRAQLHDPLGIDQRRQVVVVADVQLAQVT